MKRFFDHSQRAAALLIAAAMVFAASSCSFGNRTAVRKTVTDNDAVQLQSANSANVEIDMGPGNLQLAGGAAALMEATFKYNVPDWKPRVVYSVREGKGFLTVRQDGSTGRTAEGAINRWNLKLNDSIPIDMRVQVGAGKTNLALGSLLLNNFRLEEGAGENIVDLRGNWKNNVNVSIEGGVGKTVVQLPSAVGAKVAVEQSIGQVKAGNLTKQGDSYVNAAYGKSPSTVNVKIENGIGEVDLQQGGSPAAD